MAAKWSSILDKSYVVVCTRVMENSCFWAWFYQIYFYMQFLKACISVCINGRFNFVEWSYHNIHLEQLYLDHLVLFGQYHGWFLVEFNLLEEILASYCKLTGFQMRINMYIFSINADNSINLNNYSNFVHIGINISITLFRLIISENV